MAHTSDPVNVVWWRYSAAFLIVLGAFIAVCIGAVALGLWPKTARSLTRWMVLGLAAGVASLNLYVMASRWNDERRPGYFYREYDGGYFDGLKEACGWIRSNTAPETAVFVGAWNYERVHLLAGRRTFDSDCDLFYDLYPYREGVDPRPSYAVLCPPTGNRTHKFQLENIDAISGHRPMREVFRAGGYAVFAFEEPGEGKNASAAPGP
jgi:hypothetical protein